MAGPLLGHGLFLLQPTLLLFSAVFVCPTVLLCHSCCGVIWPKPVGLLWTCCLFFPQWLSIVIWAFWLCWASLAHLLSLGPFPISPFPWVFTNSFEFPWPNYLILHPWGSWTFHQPLTFLTFITLGLLWPILTFLHHILPMGLLLLSFWAPLGLSTSLRPIRLFHGHAIHYSCHLGLVVFLSTY